MARKRCKPEELISKIREVEAALANGRTVPTVAAIISPINLA